MTKQHCCVYGRLINSSSVLVVYFSSEIQYFYGFIRCNEVASGAAMLLFWLLCVGILWALETRALSELPIINLIASGLMVLIVPLSCRQSQWRSAPHKIYSACLWCICRDENLEKLELSEHTVNPGQPKTGPQDFELLKLLGKGGYGKVITNCYGSMRHLFSACA